MSWISALFAVLLTFAGPGSPAVAAASVPHAEGAAPLPKESDPKPAHVRASIDEGFRIESHDRDFALRLAVLTQLRYQALITPPMEGQEGEGVQRTPLEVDHGFMLRLARPVLAVNLWGDRLTARVMPELAGKPQLLDAEATVKVHPAFALHLGQYRPWISRGRRTGLPVQALPGRGATVRTFRVDRDIGLTVLGRPFEGKLEYYLGVFNGAGPNITQSASPLVTARLVYAPLGAVAYDQTPYLETDALRFAVGASAYTVAREQAQEELEAKPVDVRDVGISGDLVVSGGRLAGMAEGFWRRTEGPAGSVTDSWGSYAQLGVLAVKQRLDLVARGGIISEHGAELRAPLETGLNIYLYGHHAKLQLSYGCDLVPTRGGCVAHRAVAQAQLAF